MIIQTQSSKIRAARNAKPELYCANEEVKARGDYHPNDHEVPG
jgi:hypothetical protein